VIFGRHGRSLGGVKTRTLLAIGAIAAVVAAAFVVVIAVDDDAPQQTETTTAVNPGLESGAQTADMPAGLRAALREAQGFRRGTKIIDTRCGEYGKQHHSVGGGKALPAISRPPDEECFVYILGGSRLQFIRFADHWIHVPRGVML
jgi:hypothetical protein